MRDGAVCIFFADSLILVYKFYNSNVVLHNFVKNKAYILPVIINGLEVLMVFYLELEIAIDE